MEYERDPFGNITRAWWTGDEAGTEIVTTYDAYGRRLTMSDPDSRWDSSAPPYSESEYSLG